MLTEAVLYTVVEVEFIQNRLLCGYAHCGDTNGELPYPPTLPLNSTSQYHRHRTLPLLEFFFFLFPFFSPPSKKIK